MTALTSTVSSVFITSIRQSNRRWVCLSCPTNPSSSRQAYLEWGSWGDSSPWGSLVQSVVQSNRVFTTNGKER